MTDTQAPDTSREAVEWLIDRLERPHIPAIVYKGAAMLRALLDERDLAAAQATAAWIAGRDAAADVCTSVIKEYDVMTPCGQKYEPMKVQKAAKGMVGIARQDIRDLQPPPDLSAALDRLIAERVQEALNKARQDEIATQRANADNRDALKARLFPARGSKEE